MNLLLSIVILAVLAHLSESLIRRQSRQPRKDRDLRTLLRPARPRTDPARALLFTLPFMVHTQRIQLTPDVRGARTGELDYLDSWDVRARARALQSDCE